MLTGSARQCPRAAMDYFYDHQTDELSITKGDFATYAESRELSPGAVLHISRRRHPLALQVSGARAKVDVSGLVSFEQRTIEPEELARRMSASEMGRRLWRAISAPVHLMLAS